VSRWFLRPAPRADAAAKLFCLPYAGGTAATFRRWAALADRLDVDVHAVELPGHGRRLGEPAAIDADAVADALAAAIDRPYVIFGHSLGARLAFEVSRRLRDGGAAEPVRLYVSGSPGPRLPRVGIGDSRLPPAEFTARVARMGGTPAAILADRELRELFLPTIRADFAWGDGYRYRPAPPLSCPLSAFAATADPEAPVGQVATWSTETTGPFALHRFDGDHFFLHDRFAELADTLVRELPELATTPTVPNAGQPA